MNAAKISGTRSCEYAANPAIPTINRNTLPNTFMLIMTLPSDAENLRSQPY